MNILVTGGAGFIGSHIADRAVEQGHQVTVLDDLSSGSRANVPAEASFVELDIRDPEVRALWEAKQFDAMVHCAAQMNVRRSVEDPLFDSDVNIRGTLNLLEIGHQFGLKKVVFTSTGGAAYDDSGPFPTPETTPTYPVSPYGIAKISTELYLNYYRHQYGVDYVALRLGNVYGPRQNPHGEAGVVAIFIEKILQGAQPIINGDGLQTRDYVYCTDVAEAVVSALHADFSGVVNIGAGIETNVVELFHMIREAMKLDIPEKHGPAAQGEVRRSCLDYSKANKVLNWTPVIGFKEGIEETVRFFRREQQDTKSSNEGTDLA